MKNARSVLILAVVVAAIAALVVGGVMYRRHTGPLEFTLTFADGNDIAPGQFVMYRGVRIGEVKSVDLKHRALVNVKIDADHRAKVYREAVFTIERRNLISGERQITMLDTDEGRTPIEWAAVIEGNDNPAWVEKGKQFLKSLTKR